MTILVASDGSPPSRDALERARALARALGADLRVLPVFGSAVPTTVRRVAEAEGTDLIVVAQTPRWGGRLRLLGSVAEEIACHAPCTVLVERSDPATRPRAAGERAGNRVGPEVRSLLVPVDSFAMCAEALACALRLGRALEARVDVLHVLPPAAPGGRSSSGPSLLVRRKATDRPERRVPSAGDRGVSVGTHVRRGPPTRTIARFAWERSHDLVILSAARGLREPAASLGRVAEGLLWRAPCSVMVVRERAVDRRPSRYRGRRWGRGSAVDLRRPGRARGAYDDRCAYGVRRADERRGSDGTCGGEGGDRDGRRRRNRPCRGAPAG